jgi:hypothetical protein
MDDLIAQGLEAAKYLGPLLTGGLAGAVLTYILNRRAARRKQPRLLLTSERADFSIAATELRDLRVSYDGRVFDSLLLFQMKLENVSTRTINNTPILLLFNGNTAIVDKSFSAYPLNKGQSWTPQTGQEAAYEWNPGELKPGDWAGIRLLLAPSTEVDWTWRGDDDVEIASYGKEGVRTLEIELRDMIAWIALFIFVGGIPFLSGLLQGTLLFVSIPLIVRYFTRWWGMFNAGRGFSSSPTTILGNTSVVEGKPEQVGRRSR